MLTVVVASTAVLTVLLLSPADIDLEDPEVAEAATKIQAAFRGHRTRQQQQQGDMQPGDEEPTREQLEADFNPNDKGE